MGTDNLTMTVPEAAKALGISRNLCYELARRGELPVIRLGEKRLVISRIALERMLEGSGNKMGTAPVKV